MPLGLTKLERLMVKNHYVIISLYVYEKYCRYIRIVSTKTGETMMLFVDPMFKMLIPTESDDRVVMMKMIDFSTGENAIEKYREYPDKKELEEKYRKQITISDNRDENFEDKLEEKYKYKIFLKNMDKPKILKIKNSFRQLQRLSLLVQDLRYKMCILTENYIFCAEDDIINCYQLNTSSTETIIVIVDLEYFYKKLTTVQEDVSTIKKTMYTLINKHHVECFETIKILIDSLQKTFSSVESITSKQNSIDTNIGKTNSLLETLQTQLDIFLDQYSKIDASHEDIYVHEKKRLEDKIRKSEEVKQKLLNYILSLIEEKDNLFLTIDQVEFDTMIFLDGIKKRLEEFENLKK
jgi:hypothetical protein